MGGSYSPRVRAPLLVVLLVLAALAAKPGGAVGPPGGSVSEPGWIMLSYQGGVDVTQLRVRGGDGDAIIVGSEVRYDSGGGRSTSATWAGNEIGVSAQQINAAEPVSPFTVVSNAKLPAGKSGLLLVWSMSAASAWSWDATLAPGARLEFISQGNGGHYFAGHEMRTGEHAHASVYGFEASHSRATYQFVVNHSFIGVIGNLPPHEQDSERIELRWPDGTSQTCPCTGPAFTRPADMGPGTYQIEREGTRVGTAMQLMAGVDVPGFPMLFS